MSDFDFLVQVSKQNWKPFSHFPNSERNHLIFGATFRETKIESVHLPVPFLSSNLQLRIPKSKEICWENVSQLFHFFLTLFNWSHDDIHWECHKICMYIKYVDYNLFLVILIYSIYIIYSTQLSLLASPPQSGGPSCRALTSSESNCGRVKVEDGSHPYSKLPNMAALVVGNWEPENNTGKKHLEGFWVCNRLKGINIIYNKRNMLNLKWFWYIKLKPWIEAICCPWLWILILTPFSHRFFALRSSKYRITVCLCLPKVRIWRPQSVRGFLLLSSYLHNINHKIET